VTLRLEIDGCAVDAPEGNAIFALAELAGVRVPTSCHGNGKCRECMVEVLEGGALLSPREAVEEPLGPTFRLACRARAAGGEGQVSCRTLRRGGMRIETESALAAGGSAGPESLAESGSECCHDAPHASRARELRPAVTRAGGRIWIGDESIEDRGGPLLGLAVDVGTTTVAARLFDLGTGAAVATTAFENPQRFGGSDVMARIRYDGEHPGRLLQRALLAYLAHAIEDLPCDPQTIYEVVVCGNATMRDLFFGIDVHSIGQRPYRSVVEAEFRSGARATTSLTAQAAKLRLPVHPRARVYGLPLISGHVGADAAACALAAGLLDETRLVGLMDVGTNTELLVGNRDRLFVASCPAGPAFEGGLVACGMPALDGAVEAVRVDARGAFQLDVIGGGPPRGICGSGLIDLLGELFRSGLMDSLGRFRHGQDRQVLDGEGKVFLSEMDVSHLAQAKGAHAAGLRIVLEAAGAGLDELEVFYLAGGFARHIRIDSARRIGLIPDLPDTRIRQIGNASLAGAARALLSVDSRRRLEEYVRGAVHVELETSPSFFDHFVEGCQFQPLGEQPAEEA